MGRLRNDDHVERDEEILQLVQENSNMYKYTST
jgi:hypothetical protein